MALSARVCPVCGKSFAEQNSDGSVDNIGSCTICSRCSFVYHDDCIDKLKHCSVFGCRCSRTESVSLSASAVQTVKCPSCKENSPASASLCTKCGKLLIKSEEIPDIFSSKGGWQAETDRELCVKAASSWDTSVKHLYNGDFECWLRKKGFDKLADTAEKIRKENKHRSIGLQKFLEASGYTEKPAVKCSLKTISVEGASKEIDTAVDVTNAGYGYLYGHVTGDADWIIVQPQEFAGNRTRIMITIDMEAIPNSKGEGHLIFDTNGGKESVLVSANRISIDTALELYNNGSFFQARTLCRRLMDNHASISDACILCSVCCIEENNVIGAVSDLRLISGVCSKIPSEVGKKLFDWMNDSSNHAVSIDKEAVYRALEPIAEGTFKEDLSKSFARVRVDNASISVESGTGEGSLWKDDKASSSDIEQSLAAAAALDPNLSQEISGVRKRLKSGKSVFNFKTAAYAGVACLCLLGYGAVYMQREKKIDITSYHIGTEWKSLDLVHYDYSPLCEELRIEHQNSVFDEAVCSKYSSALLGLAQKAAERGNLALADSYFNRSANIVEVSPYAREIFTDRVLIWAKDLKKKGKDGEAYIRARQALSVWHNNPELEAFADSLQESQEKYYYIYKFINDHFSVSPIDMPLEDSSVSEFSSKLVSYGAAQIYKGRAVCAYDDIDEDGIRELIVAGTNKAVSPEGSEAEKPSAVNTENEFVVYKWHGVLLNPVYKNTVPGNLLLSNISCGNIAKDQSDNFMLSFADNKNGGMHSVFIGNYKGSIIECDLPGNEAASINDGDGNGTSEIWVSRKAADSTVPEYAVYVSVPKVWDKPDSFADASGNFEKHYRSLIRDLEDQIKANPFSGGDSNSSAYVSDRENVIKILQKRIEKGKSST